MDSFDVICIGIMVVDVLVSKVDRGILDRDVTGVSSVQVKVGGDAANQATVLSSLGSKVAIMGLVGEDQFGNTLVNDLHRANVDTRFVAHENIATGNSIVLIEESGERHFLYCGENNRILADRHIDYDGIRNARYISIGSLFALPEFELSALEKVISVAHASGGKVIADFTGDTEHLEFIKSLLPSFDWIIPSFTEACMIANSSDMDEIKRSFVQMGIRNYIIKLGENGCFVHSDEFTGYVAAIPAKMVDSTGAGDTFVASFIHARLKGYNIEESVCFANAAGAIAVESIGATGGIHSDEQVLKRVALEMPGRINGYVS